MCSRLLVLLALFAVALLTRDARAEPPLEPDEARGWWLVEGGPGWSVSEGLDGPGVSVRALHRVSRRAHLRLGATWTNASGSALRDPTSRSPRLGHILQVALEPGAELELNPGRRIIISIAGTLPIIHGRASDAEEWERVRDTRVGLRAAIGARIPLGRRWTLRPELSVLHRPVAAPGLALPPPDLGFGSPQDRWRTDWDLGLALGWRF